MGKTSGVINDGRCKNVKVNCDMKIKAITNQLKNEILKDCYLLL